MRELIERRDALGLGVFHGGMVSKGTLDREDAQPFTLGHRHTTINEQHSHGGSSITDRFGFISETNLDQLVKEKKAKKKKVKETEETHGDIQRKRERKWLHMLANWDEYMLTHYSKVRSRCRKGIPSSVRATAWLHLCGAQQQMSNPENKPEFRRLYNQNGNQKWICDIEKDLHRNFPTHELFGGIYERIGQTELYRVLKAYSVLNPVDGYCQAMAPIAALLLMNMPSEQAFWCLVAICDRYIPGYYSAGMEALKLDGAILFGLLKKVSPGVHRHLLRQEIDPLLYMTEWFLCVFARTLPWGTVMRIWDMFMCEGVKVLYRVALVLLKFSLSKSVRRKCPSMCETLSVLKNLPEMVTNQDFLVEHMARIGVTQEDMEKEHRKHIRLWREQRLQKM